MKTYAELTTVDRGAPCKEYPGEWLVIILDGSLAFHWTRFNKKCRSHESFESALGTAKGFLAYLETLKIEYNPRKVVIAWKCADNDPRIGQVWFTPFYEHGRFNAFGDYKS